MRLIRPLPILAIAIAILGLVAIVVNVVLPLAVQPRTAKPAILEKTDVASNSDDEKPLITPQIKEMSPGVYWILLRDGNRLTVWIVNAMKDTARLVHTEFDRLDPKVSIVLLSPTVFEERWTGFAPGTETYYYSASSGDVIARVNWGAFDVPAGVSIERDGKTLVVGFSVQCGDPPSGSDETKRVLVDGLLVGGETIPFATPHTTWCGFNGESGAYESGVYVEEPTYDPLKNAFVLVLPWGEYVVIDNARLDASDVRIAQSLTKQDVPALSSATLENGTYEVVSADGQTEQVTLHGGSGGGWTINRDEGVHYIDLNDDGILDNLFLINKTAGPRPGHAIVVVLNKNGNAESVQGIFIGRPEVTLQFGALHPGMSNPVWLWFQSDRRAGTNNEYAQYRFADGKLVEVEHKNRLDSIKK